jgi:hypothetical protein
MRNKKHRKSLEKLIDEKLDRYFMFDLEQARPFFERLKKQERPAGVS